MPPAPLAGKIASVASEVGREADIAVLQILDEPINLRDSSGAERVHKQRIAAKWTVRCGRGVSRPRLIQVWR